jgi:hypothetical protein
MMLTNAPTNAPGKHTNALADALTNAPTNVHSRPAHTPLTLPPAFVRLRARNQPVRKHGCAVAPLAFANSR